MQAIRFSLLVLCCVVLPSVPALAEEASSSVSPGPEPEAARQVIPRPGQHPDHHLQVQLRRQYLGVSLEQVREPGQQADNNNPFDYQDLEQPASDGAARAP